MALSLAVGVVLSGCSLLLDFDAVEGLPCPCLPDYVCLRGSNRCEKKHSVELYKSCTIDAETPDDLCPAKAICINLKGRGHRCLPACTATSYSTSEASLRIAAECPAGKTCWDTGDRGGVCDHGECEDLPNTCTPPEECVRFNGAGVCFTPCKIFESDACVGDQACHPIGASSETSCIMQGVLEHGELCSDTAACKKEDRVGRPLICDRPANSDAQRRCWAVCKENSQCVGAGETCLFARSQVAGGDLGVCVVGG